MHCVQEVIKTEQGLVFLCQQCKFGSFRTASCKKNFLENGKFSFDKMFSKILHTQTLLAVVENLFNCFIQGFRVKQWKCVCADVMTHLKDTDSRILYENNLCENLDFYLFINVCLFRFTCDGCGSYIIKTQLHCTECSNFDLCLDCHQRKTFPER